MEKHISISEKNNCISIHLEGKPSYLKIFDENRVFVRKYNNVSQRLIFITSPGKYILESDGKISGIDIKKVDKYLLFENRIKIEKGDPVKKIHVSFNGSIVDGNKIKDLVKKREIDIEALKQSIVNYYNKQFMFFLGKSNLSEAMKSLIITEIEKQTGIRVKKDLDEFVDEWLNVEKNIFSARSTEKLFDILKKFAN